MSQSDTVYKTFLTKGNIGLSACGASTIKGAPIAGYIETFLNQCDTDQTDIEQIPQKLLEFFQTTPEVPDSIFQLAGYKLENDQQIQKCWRIFIVEKKVIQVVPNNQTEGAFWNGETDVLTRLINHQIYLKNAQASFECMPSYDIPFAIFTLQDMIDFAVYAIRATAETMRFQMRSKSVGGPIDVLVIKPTGAFWISRKSLVKRDTE